MHESLPASRFSSVNRNRVKDGLTRDSRQQPQASVHSCGHHASPCPQGCGSKSATRPRRAHNTGPQARPSAFRRLDECHQPLERLRLTRPAEKIPRLPRDDVNRTATDRRRNGVSPPAAPYSARSVAVAVRGQAIGALGVFCAVLFDHRHSVPPAEPAVEVHVRAPLRAERPRLMLRRLPADGARLRRLWPRRRVHAVTARWNPAPVRSCRVSYSGKPTTAEYEPTISVTNAPARP